MEAQGVFYLCNDNKKEEMKEKKRQKKVESNEVGCFFLIREDGSYPGYPRQSIPTGR